MHRRQFLSAAAAGVAAPLLATDPPKQDAKKMLPAIDTHQHLWDPSKIKLNWLKKGDALDAKFGPEEYAAATKGLNVVKSVYMEVDVVADERQKEADYITGLCKEGKTTMAAAVLGGDPADKSFGTYVAQFKDSKHVKGFRRVLHVDATPAGYMLKDDFVKGVQLLADLGMLFDLCVRPGELPDVAKLLDQCPDNRFVLDHCGNPQAKFTAKQLDQWKADLAEVAKRKNVMVKVSGFIANGYEKGKWKADDIAPVVNTTIDTFGVKRCMFGGDWPVCTLAGSYSDWLTALRQILSNRPEEDQKRILHDNAARLYGI
ncbi:MAG: amidohydrolase family protein [Fimbriiglobus sp.]|jgi:predicted TIM-barrel fold metal-dependent hydrolase|nr:amidohydrolase family protein [Fimbriiglobus sp.]